jgi:flavin reductase (DIM6/NTAB) family NADH-FMN oxidoreductase RutF
MFATGVAIITTRVADRVHGMTANAFHVGVAAASAQPRVGG